MKTLTAETALDILEATDKNHARWHRLELAHETYAWVVVLLDERSGLYTKTSAWQWKFAERYGWFEEPGGENHTVLLTRDAYRAWDELRAGRLPAALAEGR